MATLHRGRALRLADLQDPPSIGLRSCYARAVEAGRTLRQLEDLDLGAEVTEAIRHILRDRGRLGGPVEQLEDSSNLYQAGLTSHASVEVMLALEDHFEVEFPDRMLRREVFESIAAIREAIEELKGG